MKKFFSMLLLLCGFVTISATLVGVNAASTGELSITIDNFTDIKTSYTTTFTHTYSVDDLNEGNTDVVIEAYGVYKNASGIQMNSGKGTYIKNTNAIPGKIVKISMEWTTTGKNSPTLYVSKDAVASTSSTSLGKMSNTEVTQTIDVEGDYNYFYFDGTTVTGACYLKDLRITYQPAGVSIPEYDVHFMDDTEELNTAKVYENTQVQEYVPAKTGYVFCGWYTDNETFENEWDFKNDVVTGNLNLYAKWEVDNNTHAIIDNTNFLNNEDKTSTSYTGFNGSHSLSGIVFFTDQVANDGNDILFRSNASGTGIMYNTAPISGNIKYIKLDITDGEYSVSTSTNLLNDLDENAVTLTKDNPKLVIANPNDTYFYIKIVSAGLGHVKSIDVAYEFVQKSTYTVSFNAAGGAFVAGKGEEITADNGQTTNVVLPTAADLASTLYKHTTLVAWSDGTEVYQPGKSVEVSGDTSFSAVYSAPLNLTIAQAIEIADLVGSEKTSIKFSTTATIKSKTATTIELTDDSTTETFIAYDSSKLASLKVGDVVTVTGKITTHNSGDDSIKEYVDLNKVIIKKYAYDTAFEAEQTKASLKIDAIGNVSIRFGNMISIASYNENASYGVVVSKTAADLENLNSDAVEALKTIGQAAVCTPVKVNAQGEEDANGEYYQFALVLTNVPLAEFDAVIYAAMYIKDANNNVYVAEVKSASVKSVAAAYLEGDTSNFSAELVELLQAIVNA